MKTTIISEPYDAHAVAFSYALQKKGCDVEVISFSNIPSHAVFSIGFDPEGLKQVKFSSSNILESDTCIIRRPSLPNIDQMVAKQDLDFANSTNKLMSCSIWHKISQETFCINPFEASEILKLKPIQLDLAVKSGFYIPKTVITNDCNEVFESFTDDHFPILYKNLRPAIWAKSDGSGVSAQAVTMLEKDAVRQSKSCLRLAPGIFQQYIRKKYELRVVVMGRTYF